MNKIILSLLLIIGTSTAQGTWAFQDSSYSTTANPFYTVFFLNSNLGWAGGTNGVIVKTTDGGITWTRITPPSYTMPIRAIKFISPDTGYFISNFVAGKTVTGGIGNWTLQTVINQVTTNDTLVSLYIHKYNRDVLIGTHQGTIFGAMPGQVWNARTGVSSRVNAIHFRNNDTGWVASTGGNIFYTRDYGNNWLQISGGSTSFNRNCTYRTIDTDSISGRGFIAGDSIDQFQGVVQPCYYNASRTTVNFVGFPNEGLNLNIHSIQYFGVDTLIGLGTNSMVRSTDSGRTWTQSSYSFSNPMSSGYFVNPSLGFAVGSRGIIIKYTNGPVPILRINRNRHSVKLNFYDVLGRNFNYNTHSLKILK